MRGALLRCGNARSPDGPVLDATARAGTITVHEMHNVVHDMLGQDLSVEDVFNVIQDIDEDGNGELDLEEFSVLLERFGIYH